MPSTRSDYVKENIYENFGVPATKVNSAKNREAVIQSMYRRIISEMCMNRFNWQGMPDTIDMRYLEMLLLTDALAVFYYDQEYSRYMALKGTGLGTPNMYDNPVEYNVYGNMLYSKTLNSKECVPIWANYMRIPDMDIIDVYSQRLATIARTFEIDMLHARHPFVIAVNNNEYNTFANVYKEVVDGQPVIFGTEMMTHDALANKMAAFNTGISAETLRYVSEALSRTWNECMTMLGIMNVNSEKRERMVVEEASGSSGQVLAMRAVSLNARRQACDQINRLFGLDVSVEWNLDDDADAGAPAVLGGMGGGLGSTDMEGMNPNG